MMSSFPIIVAVMLLSGAVLSTLADHTSTGGKESEESAPGNSESHQKQEHNPNMEIAEKLDDIRYKLWDVLASVDYSPVRGICFEVMDEVEELAEEIKKHPNMNHQDMAEKTGSLFSRIPDLKPALQYCREKNDAKVTGYVDELEEMTREIWKKVNALPKR
ncbi:hypothetical protein Ddc_10304 [Ditylenchus destructor]|nr:hypothetical protein Ddc_10304 [Ditylenchus destructor]